MVHFRVAEYGEALRWFLGAEAALGEADLSDDERRDELARLRSNSGLAYVELGDYESAKRVLREAADLHEGLDRISQAIISRTGLGNALREEARVREDSYRPSIEIYEEALLTLNRQPAGDAESKDRESDLYLELGRALLLDQKPGPALSFLEKSLLLTSVSNLSYHAAEHYLYIGEAHADLGASEPAERFLSKAAKLAEDYGTPETRWRALYRQALVQKADGRTAEAEGMLRRCIETIERLRSQYLPEATKVSMLSPKERPYEDLITLLCRSEEPHSDRSTEARGITEAFDLVERAKSRVFVEQLAGTDLGSSGLPVELLEEEKKLARDLRRLQSRHKAEARPQKYDWGQRVAVLEDKLERLHEKIRETGTRGREFVALRRASPLSYGEVRSLLGSAESISMSTSSADVGTVSGRRVILAEYFTTADKVLLFICRSDLDAPKLYELGVSPETLWHWTTLVLEGIKEPSEWDLSEWQAELGSLIEPIARWSEEDDVVWIVPHGDLHRLPLHALKIEERYLIERNAVVYTPSASVMRYRQSKKTDRLRTALVLGDSLGDLKHGRDEARVVADLFGVEPRIGDQATKPMLKDELERFQGRVGLLHFACHGNFDLREPLRSCILLAPHEDAIEREKRCIEGRDLSAEEILELELQAELVTLSACESGLSKRRPGDELIGLPRSFIYAGASSVVVGLWRVADESTGVLMKRFYQDLLASSASSPTKAEAMRSAQRHVMSLGGDLRHPYHWAPFILIGFWE